MNRWIMKWLCAACLCCVLPCMAFAHPHVWTTMRTGLMVNESGLITGVRMAWTFDEAYSGFALEGLDSNGDGEFGPDELKPLTVENIQNLSESDYFSVMRQGNKTLAHGAVVDFNQTYNNNQLTLYFVLPLQTPVDPHTEEFHYKIYDPDFFIAFDYAQEDPTELEGTLPTGCAMELEALKSDEELDQTKAFLSEKGKDWQNDTGEDFGGLFAQAVVVKCAS
jgi:ABC-type uncharacterized transport system substrate-binding protein